MTAPATLPDGRARRVFTILWRQLPFFVWLIALWMLLWGQFTWTAFVTGLVAAIVVTRIFRLPPVELSGRVNIWYGLVFVVTFFLALIPGSLLVEVDRPRRILYLHALGVATPEDAAHQRRAVQGWEARIVRAVGSRAQLETIRKAAVDTPRQGGASL